MPTSHHAPAGHHYRRLATMLVASFIAMFVLMYAMVDRAANALPNLNQVYMAGMMTGAMLAIEMALMGSMYPDRRVNLALLVAGVVVTAGCWYATRVQAAIGDAEFLRSMIPHHAGALLMCDEAPLERADVRRLCERIIASQTGEIALMKRMLAGEDTDLAR